jgi:four helix bundle protein
MQNPSELRVFREAEEVAVGVYRLTRTFPLEERFGLGQQMRRAAISIGSNIAEGCGRSGARDLTRFLDIALGSATELQFQLRLSHRFGYVGSDDHRTVAETVRRVERMLIRLILRVRPASETSRRRP